MIDHDETADDAIQRAPVKCCQTCAFRRHSPERSDPYKWMQLVEHWKEDGGVFYCHEGVPEHPLAKHDAERWRVCAGWAAAVHLPSDRLMRLAHTDPIVDDMEAAE